MSHKVTIKVSPDIVEAEVKTADPEQVAYVSKYLTRSNCPTHVKVHVTAEVHRVLSLMVAANAQTGATIGGVSYSHRPRPLCKECGFNEAHL